jgi:hypothetical protein
MNEITATLAKATSVARDAVSFDDVRLLPDATLLESLAAVEQLGRTVDALRVAMAAEIGERSRPTLGLDRLSAKNGCRNANELIARVTQVAETTAARWARAGAPLRPREQFTGESLPAKFAIVANAVADGRIGYDTATAITSALSRAADRAEPAMLVEAERALVASALGLDATTGEPLARPASTPFSGKSRSTRTAHVLSRRRPCSNEASPRSVRAATSFDTAWISSPRSPASSKLRSTPASPLRRLGASSLKKNESEPS